MPLLQFQASVKHYWYFYCWSYHFFSFFYEKPTRNLPIILLLSIYLSNYPILFRGSRSCQARRRPARTPSRRAPWGTPWPPLETNFSTSITGGVLIFYSANFDNWNCLILLLLYIYFEQNQKGRIDIRKYFFLQASRLGTIYLSILSARCSVPPYWRAVRA